MDTQQKIDDLARRACCPGGVCQGVHGPFADGICDRWDQESAARTVVSLLDEAGTPAPT